MEGALDSEIDAAVKQLITKQLERIDTKVFCSNYSPLPGSTWLSFQVLELEAYEDNLRKEREMVRLRLLRYHPLSYRFPHLICY